jgi:hypothetical protein
MEWERETQRRGFEFGMGLLRQVNVGKRDLKRKREEHDPLRTARDHLLHLLYLSETLIIWRVTPFRTGA